MFNNKIVCLVGRSGSGKTTVAEYFKNYGAKVLESYTTRAPRFDGEPGHIFVSNEEFDKLTDIVAYNEYCGNRYCATAAQINENDIYVVDIPGLLELKERYRGPKEIFAIGLFIPDFIAVSRLENRGDKNIARRILTDNQEFAELPNVCDVVINTAFKTIQETADEVRLILEDS